MTKVNPFLGPLIGEGIARRVYKCAPFPKYVVKVQTRMSYEDRDYQNVAEYTMWEELRNTDVGQWMAPICWISEDGKYLLQEWCKKCPWDRIPSKVPRVFADCHEDNFGLLKDKPVLIDFGRNWAHRLAANAKGMRKVEADLYE